LSLPVAAQMLPTYVVMTTQECCLLLTPGAAGAMKGAPCNFMLSCCAMGLLVWHAPVVTIEVGVDAKGLVQHPGKSWNACHSIRRLARLPAR
jgi:hypothetical protein